MANYRQTEEKSLRIHSFISPDETGFRTNLFSFQNVRLAGNCRKFIPEFRMNHGGGWKAFLRHALLRYASLLRKHADFGVSSLRHATRSGSGAFANICHQAAA